MTYVSSIYVMQLIMFLKELMIIFVKHFRKCSCKFIFETEYHDIDVIILTSFLHMNFFS